MIAFDLPILLVMSPIVGAVVGLLAFVVRRVRVRRAARWSMELEAMARSHGRFGIVLIALACWAAVVSLAGPRWGSRTVETETKGLNLVIAVDISRSMLAEDELPSRLERAKREARRLIHDLNGDRIGLIAYAGQSFIMSPLTVDGSALQLLVDALDPEAVSAGGTSMAVAIRQGEQLLLAKDEVADRVMVMFTDGEAHDSLTQILAAAERLKRSGIHLVLVAEGRREPARIPIRDLDGELIGFQRDPTDQIVETRLRDDILARVQDAAEGLLVSAQVGDQAGTIRDIVGALKRMPEATTTAAQDISRAWIPLLLATGLLILHTVTRRTTALAVLLLSVGAFSSLSAQSPRNHAERAWITGDFHRAAELYLGQLQGGTGGDTTWFNVGTAALAAGDTGVARRALERASESIEPEIRFRAVFNLGLLELRLAQMDASALDAHLGEAQRLYREALMLRPGDAAAKWNLELAFRQTPPAEGGGAEGPPPPQGDEDPEPPQPQGLSIAQAEQILSSIAEEERRTRENLNRQRYQPRETRRRRDW